jgi:hypothetical protein
MMAVDIVSRIMGQMPETKKFGDLLCRHVNIYISDLWNDEKGIAGVGEGE